MVYTHLHKSRKTHLEAMESNIVAIKIPRRCSCGNTNAYLRGEVYDGRIVARITCMQCGETHQAYNLAVIPAPDNSEEKHPKHGINLVDWR